MKRFLIGVRERFRVSDFISYKKQLRTLSSLLVRILGDPIRDLN
jgi:hypothetical protein